MSTIRISLLGEEINAKEPLPRHVDKIFDEEGEIIALVFHIANDIVPPVTFDFANPTAPSLMRSIQQLRAQDGAARRAIRREHRKRFGTRTLTERVPR